MKAGNPYARDSLADDWRNHPASPTALPTAATSHLQPPQEPASDKRSGGKTGSAGKKDKPSTAKKPAAKKEQPKKKEGKKADGGAAAKPVRPKKEYDMPGQVSAAPGPRSWALTAAAAAAAESVLEACEDGPRAGQW